MSTIMPEHIKTVTHPLVKDVFLKKGLDHQPQKGDTLIIETQDHQKVPHADISLADFLEHLEAQVKHNTDPSDLVEIRLQ